MFPLVAVLFSLPLQSRAQAPQPAANAGTTTVSASATMIPTVFYACYVPTVGTVYRIMERGLPNRCTQGDHVQFSWTDGAGAAVTDHGALTGLLDDDHPQYLRNGFYPANSTSGSRILWNPTKAAFRAGSVLNNQWDDPSVGAYSVAFGQNTIASGEASAAFGIGSVASGGQSIASGNLAVASGISSVAMGAGARASGPGSVALGAGQATGNVAVALGSGRASGEGSMAIGNLTEASGSLSTAMGSETAATGSSATAMGYRSAASGSAATAFGDRTLASGAHSLAAGYGSGAGGDNSTALGNMVFTSGNSSVVMGAYASDAGYRGSFVFGDNSTAGFTSVEAIAPNQFVARASGGFRFRTAADLSTGCNLAAGSGVLSCTSSRLTKKNFEPLDGEAVLGKLAGLSIQRWSYKTEPGVRHVGPTAEDFRAAFGLGRDSTAIGSIDADGINMLSIQALEARTLALAQEKEVLRRENVELRARLARLEAVVRRLSGAQ